MAKTVVENNATPPEVTIELDGNTADIKAGGHGTAGDLTLFDGDGEAVIQLTVTDPPQGGVSTAPPPQILPQPRIHLDGEKGKVAADLFTGRTLALDDGSIRMWGQLCRIELWQDGRRVLLDGKGGNLWLGGNGVDGDVVLFPSRQRDTDDGASHHDPLIPLR